MVSLGRKSNVRIAIRNLNAGLTNAQGFPADVIEGVWREDEDGEWTWDAFAKNVQVSCCGNSVCPPLTAVLLEAPSATSSLAMTMGHIIPKCLGGHADGPLLPPATTSRPT